MARQASARQPATKATRTTRQPSVMEQAMTLADIVSERKRHGSVGHAVEPAPLPSVNDEMNMLFTELDMAMDAIGALSNKMSSFMGVRDVRGSDGGEGSATMDMTPPVVKRLREARNRVNDIKFEIEQLTYAFAA